MDVVSTPWNKPIKYGKDTYAASILCQKLKLVKHALTRWSKGISRLSIALQNTNKAILKMDTIEERRHLTVPETNYRRILKYHLLRLLQHLKEYWKKCCTIRWILFGDENSQFFQGLAID